MPEFNSGTHVVAYAGPVRLRLYIAAAGASLGLTLLAAWVFEWPFEKAALLSPVIVVGAGAVAGLIVLWTRVAWESIRRREHPARIIVLAVGALVLLAGLSLLGLKLPRE